MANPAWTHRTAVVFIPPAEVWPPIQAIRREHDRQLQRWMPHVTLLYPFAPRDEVPGLLPALESACAALRPFEAVLASVGQSGSASEVQALLAQLSETWTPLVFQVTEVSIIAREENRPFEVIRTLRLG